MSSFSSRSFDRSLSRKRTDRVFTILVKPPAELDYDKAVAKLTSLLPSQSLSVKVRKTRRIRDGFAIDLDSVADRDRLFEALLSNAEIANLFVISRPKMRHPQIMISGLNSLDRDTIANSIYEKNPVVPKDSLTFEFSFMMRGLHNVIFSVDPVFFGPILEAKFLYVGWHRLGISEHISVMQCSRCGRLGHTKGRCPHPTTVCKTCALDSVRTDYADTCKITCVNCSEANEKFKLSLGTDHRCNDGRCPRLQRARLRAAENVDYGP